MFNATRLHERHDRFRPASAAPVVGVHTRSGELIADRDLALVEELDDAMFSALDGNPDALDRCSSLWRQLKQRAPEALIEESREQYIRRALAICEQFRFDPQESLGRGFAAMEVLTLLAE